MSIELSEVECINCILVSMNIIGDNTPSMSGDRGIETDYLSRETSIEVEKLKVLLNNLSTKNYTEWVAGERIKLTDYGKDYLNKNSTYTLKQTAELILKKTYDIYVRDNYNDSYQFNSFIIGSYLGISNNNKVNSAVKYLIENGYFEKIIITRFYIMYSITNYGINFMENDNIDENEKAPISITNNFYSEVTNSQIQQFSNNSVQTIENGINTEKIYEIIKTIEENYKNLDANSRISIEPNIEDIKTEIKKTNPDNNKIKNCFQTIRNVLEGVAGNIIAAGILYYLKPLVSKINKKRLKKARLLK